MNSAAAIESAWFRNAAGISDDQLLAASAAVQDWLRQQPGFRSRLLAKGSEGEWLDLVMWDSLADAERAAAAIGDCPDIGPFMQAMEPESVQLKHFTIRDAFGG